jgi:hypothetical protein
LTATSIGTADCRTGHEAVLFWAPRPFCLMSPHSVFMSLITSNISLNRIVTSYLVVWVLIKHSVLCGVDAPLALHRQLVVLMDTRSEQF